ncbi:MAG: hypothetical protein KAW00_07390 [Dehalococcoidia bacterium]|nr:hypothetical protein [Dehalococcoidia bacterium]
MNVMDWRFLVTIVIVVALGIATIVLARKNVKKRQPVWAYKTIKIIGLGSDAPSDLELTFNEQPISDVYQTRFILFNKGNEAILKDNVAESIAIQFKGAEILRQPDIKAESREAIGFSAKQVVKGGYNSVEVNFLYLDHDDGAVVDVLHTASEEITCTANIVGARQIKNIGVFESPAVKALRGRFLVTLVIIIAFFGLLLYRLLSSPSDFVKDPGNVAVLILLSFSFYAISIRKPFSYFHHRRFPRWSAVND